MTDQKPVRRVGVFTMGISLISSGVALCLWQLFPSRNIWDLLRFSPAFLVVLGIEILLSNAANRNGVLKYDWLSMILCCIIICACITLSALGTYFTAEFPL